MAADKKDESICTRISADMCDVFDSLARMRGTDRSGLLRSLVMDFISENHKQKVALDRAFGKVDLAYLVDEDEKP